MATLKKKPSRLSTFFSSSSFSSSTDLSLPPQEQPPPQPQAQLHPDVPRGRFRQDSLPPPPSVNLHPTFVPDQFAAHHRVASGPAYYTPPAPENAPPPPPAHGDLPPPYQPGQQPSPQPDNPHKSPSILRKPVATSSEQVRSRSPLRKSASHANLAVPGLQPIALRDGAKSQPGSRPSTPDEKAREKKLTRKSWFGGGGGQESSRSKAQQAWVVTGRETGGRGEGSEGQPKPVEEYPLGRLFGGNMIPELWDENGNAFIHLFPKASNKGPSFRIHSHLFAESPGLNKLARANQTLEAQMSGVSLAPGSTEGSDGGLAPYGTDLLQAPEIHLYLPLPLSINRNPPQPGQPERLTGEDMDVLINVRNVFSFLVGQSLVATERIPTPFHVFMNVAEQLNHFEFSNIDGSTFGEAANTSFTLYIDELGLADVRSSRENTIEAVVLAERMRSVVLYNEAFVHAVGKYEEIDKVKSPKFELISPMTRNRLERASMDLFLRQKTLNSKLEDFQFPFLFSGIMNSKTSEEGKLVRFDVWKENFMVTRRFILGYYKDKYGAWPPKARHKKNALTIDGLNRIVLKSLYADLAQLYDLLVDRTALTPRSYDGVSQSADSTDPTGQNPMAVALRCVLSEYDRSVPPVLPPIPFDLPIFPTLTRPDFGRGDTKHDTKTARKKLKDGDLHAVLRASRNPDAAQVPTPFLAAFQSFEAKFARGTTLDDLREFRAGLWLFLYAVFQSLPLLVVDAPGVRFTDGVEYFLCQPPRAGAPWAKARADGGADKTWFGVAGTTGVVSMPMDVIKHGVEGVYRRSHAWVRGDMWAKALGRSGVVAQVDGARKAEDGELASEPRIPVAEMGAGTPPFGPGSSSFVGTGTPPFIGAGTPPFVGAATPPLGAVGGAPYGVRPVSRALDSGLQPVRSVSGDDVSPMLRPEQGGMMISPGEVGGLPPPAAPGRMRALSHGRMERDRKASMTFDDILGTAGKSGNGKKKR